MIYYISSNLPISLNNIKCLKDIFNTPRSTQAACFYFRIPAVVKHSKIVLLIINMFSKIHILERELDYYSLWAANAIWL